MYFASIQLPRPFVVDFSEGVVELINLVQSSFSFGDFQAMAAGRGSHSCPYEGQKLDSENSSRRRTQRR